MTPCDSGCCASEEYVGTGVGITLVALLSGPVDSSPQADRPNSAVDTVNAKIDL